MALPWNEIEESETYTALTDDEQDYLKQSYFDQAVAPSDTYKKLSETDQLIFKNKFLGKPEPEDTTNYKDIDFLPLNGEDTSFLDKTKYVAEQIAKSTFKSTLRVVGTQGTLLEVYGQKMRTANSYVALKPFKNLGVTGSILELFAYKMRSDFKLDLKFLGVNDSYAKIFDAIPAKLIEWGRVAREYWNKAADNKALELDDSLKGAFMDNPSWLKATTLIAGAIPSLFASVTVGYLTKKPMLAMLYMSGIDAADVYVEGIEKGKTGEEASYLFDLAFAGSMGTNVLLGPFEHFAKGTGSRIKNIVLGGLLEGTEEMCQQFSQNLIVKIGIDKTRSLFEGIIESFIGGAGSGGAIGGFTTKGIAGLNKAIADAKKNGATDAEIEQAFKIIRDVMIRKAGEIEKELQVPNTTNQQKFLKDISNKEGAFNDSEKIKEIEFKDTEEQMKDLKDGTIEIEMDPNQKFDENGAVDTDQQKSEVTDQQKSEVTDQQKSEVTDQDVAEKMVENNREKVAEEETISAEEEIELVEEVKDVQASLEILERKVQEYIDNDEGIPISLKRRLEAVYQVLGIPLSRVKSAKGSKKNISVNKLLGKFDKKITVSEAKMLKKIIQAEQKASREGYKEGRKQQKEIQDTMTDALKEQQKTKEQNLKKKYNNKTDELKAKQKAKLDKIAAEKKSVAAIKKAIVDFAKAHLDKNQKWTLLNTIRNATTVKNLFDAFEKIKIIETKAEIAALRKQAKDTILKNIKNPEKKIDVEFQNRIEKILSTLGENSVGREKTLNNITVDELVALADEIMGIREEGIEQFKIKQAHIKKAADLLKLALLKDVGALQNLAGIAVGSQEEKKILKQTYMTRMNLQLMRPTAFLKKILGKTGVILFGDTIDVADTNKSVRILRRQQKISESRLKHKIKTFILGKVISITRPAVDMGGTGQKLLKDNRPNMDSYTVNQILRMYLAKGDPASLKALIGGTFKNDIDAEARIDALIKEVKTNHPEYLKFADDVQQVVAEAYTDVMEVMARVYNMPLSKVKKYFPLYRQYDATESESLSEMEGSFIIEETSRNDKADYTSIEKKFTFKRKDIDLINQKPISLDFIGDTAKIIEDQEQFINFASLQKTFNVLKADLTLKHAVIANHGQEAWNIFEDYLKKVISPKLMYRDMSRYGRLVRGAISTTYLAGSVITAMKQLPSMWLVKRDTSTLHIMHSALKVLTDKATRNRIYELDPSLQTRVFSRTYDEIMRTPERYAANDMLRRVQIARQEIGNVAFGMILNMDKFAVLAAYDAVYNYQVRRVGEEEAKRIAHKSVLDTQPQGKVKDLPALYRTNNELLKYALMFSRQLNQIYNMLVVDTANDFNEGNKMRAMESIASVGISSMLIYLATHGLNPPDDEADWLEFLFGSAVSAVPFAGTLAMATLRGYSYSMSPLTALLETVQNTSLKIGKGDGTAMDYVRLMTTVSMISGQAVPGASQIMRTGSGVIDLLNGDTEDLRRLVWSEAALE